MSRSWIGLVSLLAVLTLAGTCAPAPAPTAAPTPTEAPAATEPAAAEAPFKVAFVYVAPIGDLGWTYQHDLGRLAIEERFGDRVETAFIENVPEGPEAERVIRDFAQQGFDLVITTSFGYMDPTFNVAQEFPDRWFAHISGFKTRENMSAIFGRIYQARYLSGLVAGPATESNLMGYVAAFPIPEVIRGINAFTLGVREVNPEARVRVVWTNTWFGPPQEREAAEQLLAAGADVIAQHQDTTEPQKAAQEAGAVSIGYDSDMRQFVGDTVLTSPVWNWGVKYVDIVESIMAGAYQSENWWGGMDTGVVELAELSPQVSPQIAERVRAEEARLIAGDDTVFCGPITDQAGELRVAEGECLSDEEMLSMDWFVEGVEGEPSG